LALSERMVFALLIMISVVLVLFTLLFYFSDAIKFVLVIVALAFDVLAFSTKYYFQFFVPFLGMKGRTVVLKDGEAFTMAPSGNAIVVRNGQDTYASAIVRIPSYRSATEMNPAEKTDFAKMFGRVLSLARSPVKFAAQLYVINKDEYIANIKNKLDEAEERYQSTIMNKGLPKAESERVRGEVTMWHNLFDSVNKTRSLSLEAYAMVTSPGNTEEEAVNLALQQADEIATGISAIFGIAAGLVEGKELLKFLEPDYLIPAVTISEQMREKTVDREA
jgi:hypothetical protein